jgi:hypothetical protein
MIEKLQQAGLRPYLWLEGLAHLKPNHPSRGRSHETRFVREKARHTGVTDMVKLVSHLLPCSGKGISVSIHLFASAAW